MVMVAGLPPFTSYKERKKAYSLLLSLLPASGGHDLCTKCKNNWKNSMTEEWNEDRAPPTRNPSQAYLNFGEKEPVY
uniref:Uncharacterized protein n=1 Tax=Pristionchus pacificus TaxID=54126 RepID=A0A2A6BUN4_PRIPA|eukprot:PDM69471.1 hypothetical protein PRIPAC_44567 [Pristionchus pacificus]